MTKFENLEGLGSTYFEAKEAYEDAYEDYVSTIREISRQIEKVLKAHPEGLTESQIMQICHISQDCFDDLEMGNYLHCRWKYISEDENGDIMKYYPEN